MKLFNGDCLDVLKTLEDNSIDSCVTDPPSGCLGFMGKSWDQDKGGRDHWIKWLQEIMVEVHRVLKPGGHMLCWAIPRGSHWTATAIENAGFEIRDIINHAFFSGFPKSLNVGKAIDKINGIKEENNYPSIDTQDMGFGFKRVPRERESTLETDDAKQWSGYGTALKPSVEHYILARKPIEEKTVAKNVLRYGTGSLNIDASRIPIKANDSKTPFPVGNYSTDTATGKIRGDDRQTDERNTKRQYRVVDGKLEQLVRKQK
jgi:site-specific DNA-methyltransferase (adenine-specific)